MTTLREYIQAATGRFLSPNHPVPMSGDEYLAILGDGDIAVAGHADYDLADLPVRAEPQESGDVWIYPEDSSVSGAGGPVLVHQRAQASNGPRYNDLHERSAGP